MPDRVDDVWPALPQSAWSETCTTLRLWMQIVGKVRLSLMPAINHAWSVTLYPSIRGVNTSIMPYGTRTLQIDFDFRNHELQLEVSEGRSRTIPLEPMTVAAFYEQVMAALDHLGTPVRIWPGRLRVATRHVHGLRAPRRGGPGIPGGSVCEPRPGGGRDPVRQLDRGRFGRYGRPRIEESRYFVKIRPSRLEPSQDAMRRRRMSAGSEGQRIRSMRPERRADAVSIRRRSPDGH